MKAGRALYEFDGEGIERVVVVGDIHGDYDALRSLEGKIEPCEAQRVCKIRSLAKAT